MAVYTTKEIITKIAPFNAKKHSMSLEELGELLKRLPALELDDNRSFEEDIKIIRSKMSYKENS